MSKIWLITQREYLTRIKKRSFIIMSVLGPIFIAAFFGFVFYMASVEDTDVKKIAVIDSSKVFIHKIPDTKYLHFEYMLDTKLEQMKKNLKKSDYYGILYISPIVTYSPRAVQFYSYQQPSFGTTQHISNAIENELRDQKLLTYKIENIDKILKSIETHIAVETVKLSGSGEEKIVDKGIKMWVAYISSLLIYMFILMYGVQVMRGVIEEKTSRIVEVVISSVKPFQLMMGKVLGVAMAAITQFIIWIALSYIFVSLVKGAFMPDITSAAVANQPHDVMDASNTIAQVQQAPQISPELANAFSILDKIDFYVLIGSFLFYFIAGYLLYASLFAAVGAAVDNETDTQQFVVPVTIPLIIAIVVMINAFQNPDSSIAMWFSIIPFTSPIVMMARIAYGVPWPHVFISMSLLVLTFVATIWLAGKIYRTGILMYGNKSSFREMIKWLRYKN
jgi:ABC-2 type transport system permease protein